MSEETLQENAPKVFISYSWSSEKHENWVLNLATELRENSVDAKIDKWDLIEGQDKDVFMEQMVTDESIKKVILICDKKYVEKANARSGGVGVEAQIMTPELYGKMDQTKFVAIFLEKDQNGEPMVPSFLRSRYHIDFSEDHKYPESFEQLLRWIFDEPIHKRPPLGKAPSFITNPDDFRFKSVSKINYAIRTIEHNESNWKGALDIAFSEVLSDLNEFVIEDPQANILDEQIIEKLEQSIPLRNSLISLFQVISKYNRDDLSALEIIHSFFEELHNLPALFQNPQINGVEYDHFRFLVQELYLYLHQSLLKRKAYDAILSLLKQRFITSGHRTRPENYGFQILRHSLRSFEFRNRKNRRISTQADLLKERCRGVGVKFEELLETDFILYIHTMKNEHIWWPDTCLYAEYIYTPLPFFVRAQSKELFQRIKGILNVESIDEFKTIVLNPNDYIKRKVGWETHLLDVAGMTGINEIASIK